MTVVTAIKAGDIIAWGTPGEYERRGIVRAISRDNATLYVHQTQPSSKHCVSVPSHQARKVRLSSTS
jgi:uncharacterized protein YijF (DUF1287 family)